MLGLFLMHMILIPDIYTNIWICLPLKYHFPLANVSIIETNKDEYILNTDSIGQKIYSKDETNFYYTINNKQAKYVTGTITYKIKPENITKNTIIGRMCYFKFKI